MFPPGETERGRGREREGQREGERGREIEREVDRFGGRIYRIACGGSVHAGRQIFWGALK
jgi:hypothetical protein